MHELPVTKKILDIVLKHASINNVSKVLAIHIEIGELSDLENEWIQRYFDYVSKGTLAEGAKLNILRTPVVVKCDLCSHSFKVDIKQKEEIECLECGARNYSLISGRDYYIKDMEVL